MGIQTSQITTQNDGDLSINPDGTGKVVLPKLSGSGEIPMGVDSNGNIKPLDERQFNALTAVDPGDYIMVQRGADYFYIDASELGGASFADPNPGDITWTPSDPPGSGTQADPYVLTPASVSSPGGAAISVEQMIVSNQRPDSLLLINEIGGTSGTRFNQAAKICDNNGAIAAFPFEYLDTPASTSGQVYDGLMKVGNSSVYVKWEVTQQANQTSFGPASAPTASPTTVDYAADGKYGTVSATWADGDHVLNATEMVFSVNGGPLDSSSRSVTNGDTVAIGFVDATVASAAEGATITGTLQSSDGAYYSEFKLVKKTTPAPFTIQPGVDRAVSTETNTGNEPIKGINAPTTVTAAGSGSNPLTSTTVSVNGGSKTASTTFNPGDSLQGFGTTGASTDTTYQATFTVGGVASTWDVTTAGVPATIEQPSIESPSNGSTDLAPDVVLTGSTYQGLNGANAHASSTWEVYEAGIGALKSDEITGHTPQDGGWNAATAAENNAWHKLAYGNGTWVCVAGDGTNRVMYSTDGGKRWTAAAAAEQNTWNGVAFGNNRFVAVASDGTNRIMQSPDGKSWTPVSGAPALAYQRITFGNNKFVAVAFAGANPSAYSTDGVTWTQSTNCPTSTWNDVSYGNGVYVATATGGSHLVMRSDDGENWTSISAGVPVDGTWYGVTYGNGTWVAVSATGLNRAMYSNNGGVNWTQTMMPEQASWFTVGYGNGNFIALNQDGSSAAASSPDGVNWTPGTVRTPAPWFDIEFGGGNFVAVAAAGSTRVMYSEYGTGRSEAELTFASDKNLAQFIPGNAVEQDSGHTPTTSVITDVDIDDESWNLEAAPAMAWTSIAYGDGTYVAVAKSGTGNRAMYSEDGLTWTQTTTPEDANWASVTYGAGKFVAVAQGSGTKRVMISDNGITWASATAADTEAWVSVTYGMNQFVAIARGSNQIMRSPDGISWTLETLPQTKTWQSITYGLNADGVGMFVAVGESGSGGTVYSYDGITWNSNKIQGNFGMNSVTAADGMFVGVLENGEKRVQLSTDGISWRYANTTPKGFQGNRWVSVTYGNGLFVAVADTSTERVMSSRDAMDWTEAECPDDTANWTSVTYGDGKFIAVANNGLVMMSEGGTGGQNPTLTLQDDTDLENFRVGDVETGGNTITAIGPGNTLTLNGGTWNVGGTVVGPEKKGTGTLASISGTTATLSSSNGEWCSNVGVSMADPLIEGLPGAPTTEPPSADYTAITPSATTLTTATLDDTNLSEDKAYYSRVQYSDGTITSEFSEYNEFTTADVFVPKIGAEYGGGYFAGQMMVFAGEEDGSLPVSNTVYNLIVAPRQDVGLVMYGEAPALYKYKTASTADSPGNVAKNLVVGIGATVQFADTSHPGFNWVVNSGQGPNGGNYDTTNSAGTGIGGYNDWYLPALYELETLYFNLKPGTVDNVTTAGSNPNALPPYPANTNWTTSVPAQTTVEIFQEGNAEAFYATTATASQSPYYMSSSEQPTNGAYHHRVQFRTGSVNNGGKAGDSSSVRAIRREPA